MPADELPTGRREYSQTWPDNDVLTIYVMPSSLSIEQYAVRLSGYGELLIWGELFDDVLAVYASWMRLSERRWRTLASIPRMVGGTLIHFNIAEMRHDMMMTPPVEPPPVVDFDATAAAFARLGLSSVDAMRALERMSESLRQVGTRVLIADASSTDFAVEPGRRAKPVTRRTRAIILPNEDE